MDAVIIIFLLYMWGSMKRQISYGVLVISLVVTSSLHGAQTKPSPWQKFKNVFSSKKAEPTDHEKAVKDYEKAQEGVGLFQSIKKLYGSMGNFYAFSQEHMLVLGLKIKGLKAMQEEGKKNNQKEQLALPLKRLRVDFFMSLVEYLQQVRMPVQAIKLFMQERGYSSIKTIDTILQTLDGVIKEGDQIVERLLQASKAYGLKDDPKKVENQINTYFTNVAKTLSSMKKVIDDTQSIINKALPILKGINIASMGGMTTLVVFARQLNNALKLFQIATGISKDVTDFLDNDMAKQASTLQDQSTSLINELKASNNNIQKIQKAFNVDILKAEMEAGKRLDEEDQSEDLVFEDLRSKK